MTHDSAISTVGLTKHYPGVAALTDLTLDVPAGSIYGFLGPNGAGKSTTIKMLAGLTKPTSGTRVGRRDPRPRRRRLPARGRLPRPGAAVLRLDDRSRDAAVRRLALSGRRAGPTTARIAAILARVGLADAADRRTDTYSGGMRQRLGIAQALVGSPAVLLLDEPVSALDPIGRREVLDLMRELRGEVTVFYSTHILDDVERVSDHVAILDGGRLVRSAPTAELLASFDQDQLRVVLGGADDATAVALTAIPGVVSVEPAERDADASHLHRPDPSRAPPPPSRPRITRFAVDHGLIVSENHLVRLGLEDVFLRLVDTKERAA